MGALLCRCFCTVLFRRKLLALKIERAKVWARPPTWALLYFVLFNDFTTKWREAGHLHFYIIFALALSIRAAYILQIDGSPLFVHPVVDGKTYVQHAESLAAGNWLGLGQGPFWQPPLYPYFLGLIKAITADSFFYVIRWSQALFGALTCGLIYLLGTRWYNTQVGFTAALAACFYGPLIFFDGEVLPTSLATLLNLSGLLVLDRALENDKKRQLWAAGFIFGLAALTVASVLSFVAVVTGWIYWQRRSLLAPTIFALGVVVAIAPVTARNYALGNDSVLISYNSGVNFYIGNNAEYQKTLQTRAGWEWDELIGEPAAVGIEQSSQRSAYFWHKAWSYISSQPFHYLQLQIRKGLQYLNGDEVGRNQDIYYWRHYSSILTATLWKWGIAFPFGLLCPLALLGLGLVLRHKGTNVGTLFALTYSAGVFAFFPVARYRVPVLPILLLLAAYAGWWLWQRMASGQQRQALWALITVVAVGLVTNAGIGRMNMGGNAEIHYNLGQAYSAERQGDTARHHFAQAVTLDSTYWQAWLNLGSIAAIQGDLEQAKGIFRRVAQAQPQRPEAWVNLAHSFMGLRQSEAAVRAYEQALMVNPRQPRIYAELLQLHFQRRSLAEAKRLLTLALEHYPQDREKLLRLYGSMRQRFESAQQ